MAATVERPPTPEQAAAIGAPGLVFVSAGAGTGKTTVLVERFVRAIEAGVDVASILVITYTDRAAAELRARIRKRLADVKIQMTRRMPNFTVDFDCPPDITDDSIATSLRDKSHLVLLYRIVSEAMINARKHSQGTHIALRVRRPRLGLVEITVSDNGRGSGGPFEQSFGIDLMQRRAEDIGAEIEYKKTSAAGGTTVVIRLAQNEVRVGNGSKVSGVI